MFGTNVNIDSLIKDALSTQDERSERVILGRYGLGPSGRRTLAEIGEEYGLTRERVRQIQAAALKTIHDEIKGHKEAVKLLKALEKYLKDVGDIRRADHIAQDLSIALRINEDAETLSNKLHFLADALKWPHVELGNEDWHPTWYSKKEVYETARKMVSDLLKTKEHDFEKFLGYASNKYNMPEPQVVNHLIVSRRFNVGPYGHMGADHWVKVNPKTVRDKIYVVLDEAEGPMHFREIADSVNELGNKKRASATVHNELIKDPRFVLVGRGTYTTNA